MITNIDFCAEGNTFGNSLHSRIVAVNLEDLKREVASHGELNEVTYFLTEEEQQRFSCFRYEKRKIEWLGGRIAAKCSALQLVNNSTETCWKKKDWHQAKIEADNHGKPFFVPLCPKKQLPPFVSISHSSGIAVGMASWANCGIDIQKITTRVENILPRFALAEEVSLLQEVIEQQGKAATLTMLWSAKEAIKKGTLQGALPGFMTIKLHSYQLDASCIFLIFSQIDKEQSEQFVSVQIYKKFALARMLVKGG